MKEPVRPVFWYQGLFLQPQHFQQADLYSESLTAPLKRYMQPFFWGTCEMAVDEGALKESVFELSEGKFIFQDGSYVSISENAHLRPRSFKDYWVQMEKPLKVYIGLKEWDRKGNNVSVLGGDESSQSARSRFVTGEAAEEVDDLYQKEQPAQIKLLDYLLKVFWEGEAETTGGYHLIPVAVLEFDGQDVQISKEFEPPTVTLSSSASLSRIVKNIFELVSSRCAILEEYKNPRGFQTGAMQAAYLTFFLAFRTLGRFLPVLRHFMDAPHVHPWNVYCLLRQFIGDLSSFSERIDVLGRLRNGVELVPPYDHEKLGYCFRQVQRLIEEIIGLVLVGIENIVYLYRDGIYFQGQIPSAFLDVRNTFYLITRTSEDPATVVEMMKHTIKVGCKEDMPLLIQRAIPGVPLTRKTELPAGVPTRSDMVCFEIDSSSKFWQNIMRNANICLYWSDAPEDAAAELLIIRL